MASGIAAIAARAMTTPEKAARQAERHDLQHVDGDDLTARGAETLQHGDAPDLLQHEDTGDARHRDAAEDDDDQADEAEVVLRPIEIPPDRIVGRTVRTRVDVVLAEVVVERLDQVVEALVGDARQHHTAGATAERQQAGCRHVVEIDEDARPECEAAQVATRFVGDDAANDERRRPDRQPRRRRSG